MRIKIICINLKKSTERRINATNVLSKLFNDFYFFDAIEGNEVNILDTDKSQIKLLEYRNNHFLHNILKRDTYTDLKLSYGEIGCALSHICLYKHLNQDPNYDAYFIFEDDITFDMNKKPDLMKCLRDKYIDINFDICFFHSYDFESFYKLESVNSCFNKLLYGRWFSENRSYIITKQGANKILIYTKSFINYPADDLLCRLHKLNLLNIIASKQKFFNGKNYKSDIWNIYKDNEIAEKVIWDKPYVKYDGIYNICDLDRIHKCEVKNKFITMTNIANGVSLGNQMFQYAVLRYLSIANKLTLKIPLVKSNDKYHNFVLDNAFDIKFDILLNSDIIEAKYKEPYFHYANISISNNTDIEGYFQSYKYFFEIWDTIRSDFTFKKEIRNKCDPIIQTLRKTFSEYRLVALHVRRGDFCHPNTISEVITIKYVNSAIEYILTQYSLIKIIVFSDDKNWCKNNIINPNVIDICNETEFEDMYMMTQCDDFILSASTFGWWGAYLSTSIGKIVIVPDPWFNKKNNNVKNNNVNDLIPKDWIKMAR